MSIAVVGTELRFTYQGDTYAYSGTVVGSTTAPPRSARINGEYIEYVDENQDLRRLPRSVQTTTTDQGGKIAIENALVQYVNQSGDTEYSAFSDTPHSDVSHDDFDHSDKQFQDDAHDDKSHDDTPHDDDAHQDDPEQFFPHQDELHSDTHTDHSDLQAPIGHADQHSDSVHVDQAHEDKSHSDKNHDDINHDDDAHDDKSHSDDVHNDSPPHANSQHQDEVHSNQPFRV